MSLDIGGDLLGNLIGGKPTMPKLDKLNLGSEQQSAINANSAAIPQLEGMASGINSFNQAQLAAMLEKVIPGYSAMKQTGSDQIQKMMKGEIPLSDQKMSQLSSVAKSFGGGYAGSGSMGNLVARDLGLKELDVVNKGLSSAESWMRNINAMEKPSQFDFSSMFITPMQQYQTSNEQNVQQFQHDWSKNVMDWQHSPGAVVGGDIQQMGGMASSIFGQAAGSAAGKAAGSAAGKAAASGGM